MDPYLAKLIGHHTEPSPASDTPIVKYTIGSRTLYCVRRVLTADEWHALYQSMLALRVRQEQLQVPQKRNNDYAAPAGAR